MREKRKEGKVVSLNLDLQEIELMDFDMRREGFKSRSEYVGWLITSRNHSVNPAEHLRSLEKEEQELHEQINKIRFKREEAIKNIELTKEIDLVRMKKRPDAIKIIGRKILEEGILVAEQYAKNWARMLNCSHTELLFEATRNIQKDNKNIRDGV